MFLEGQYRPCRNYHDTQDRSTNRLDEIVHPTNLQKSAKIHHQPLKSEKNLTPSAALAPSRWSSKSSAEHYCPRPFSCPG